MEPLAKSAAFLPERLKSDPELRVVTLTSVKEMVDHVQKEGAALLLLSSSNRDQLVKAVSALKLLRPAITSGKVKVVSVTALKDPEVSRMLLDYGCSEVILEPASEKTVYFKFSRIAKLMIKSAKAGLTKHMGRGGRGFSAGPSSWDAEGSSNDRVKIVEPIKTRSDCWIYRSGSARRVMGRRWAVRMLGPGPSCGKWIEDKEQGWKWTPNDQAKTLFMPEPGTWIFKGDRPEIQEDAWVFAGEKIELVFILESILGEKPEQTEKTPITVRRFWVENDQTLYIAEDSKAALDKAEHIRASLDVVILVKKETQKSQEGQTVKPKAQAQGVENEELEIRVKNEDGREITDHRRKEKPSDSTELKGRFSKDPDREWGEQDSSSALEQKEVTGSAEEVDHPKTQESKELEIRLKAEEVRDIVDHRKKEDKREGSELKGTFSKEKSRDWGKQDSQTDRTDEESQSPEPAKRKKVRESKELEIQLKEAEHGEISDHRRKEKSPKGSELKGRFKREEDREWQENQSKEERQNKVGLNTNRKTRLRRESRFRPVLAALALSEKLVNVETDLTEVVSWFCDYLGSRLGAKRLELWQKSTLGWTRIQSSPESPSPFVELVQIETTGLMRSQDGSVVHGTLRTQEGQVSGALILELESGAELTDSEFMAGMELCQGLLLSLWDLESIKKAA